MKILVYDVAAENGGAISILKQYHSKFSQDTENEYVFVLSKKHIDETDNIKVIVLDKVKKSWFHRVFYDFFVTPKMVREYGVDRVLSLQNLVVPRTKVFQTVYFHNLLALTKEKFSIFGQTKLWVYKNVIGKIIRSSLKRADQVIVQAEWIKEECVRQNIKSDRIVVEPPVVELQTDLNTPKIEFDRTAFFFPASAAYFKNHRVIVEACEILKKAGVDDYKVIFTLEGNEEAHIFKLFERIQMQSLPIEFCGMLNKDDMSKMYNSTILLFPSYIETIGLPLLEARQFEADIICSDCQYARAVLSDYEKVQYFDPHDPVEISELMKKKIQGLI